MRMRATLVAVLMTFVTSAAIAAPIFYQATDLVDDAAGDLWRYDYFIANQTGDSIAFFDILFGLEDYEFNLISTPGFGDEVDPADIFFAAAWDGFVAPDDPILVEDGFLSINQIASDVGPISIADAITSISSSVTFIWEGVGTPGEQVFEYFNNNGDFLGGGLTQLYVPPVSNVPEPGSILLFGTALLLMLRRHKRITANLFLNNR